MISIITINYNDAAGLEATIRSVANQTHQDYEHVVIDGDSSDGSKEVIQKYRDHFSYAVSEPDSGIYNAMNKGIRASKGDYLLFLNSGDALFDNDVLEKVAVQLSDEYKIYYGNVLRVFNSGVTKTKYYPKELSFSFFVDSALAHQTVFIDRKLFSEISYYNESYQVLADWEFLILAICKQHIPYKHLGMVVANYDMTGISSQPEGKKIMKQERDRCYREHFPLFYKDYLELLKTRALLNSRGMRLYRKIQENKMTQKLNYWVMKLLSKFV